MRWVIAALLASLALAGCTGRLARVAPSSPDFPVLPSPSAGYGPTIDVPAPAPHGRLPLRSRSDVSATLPRTGTIDLAGVTLTGRRVRADSDLDGRPDGPAVLWTTDHVLDDAGDVWQLLARAYRGTGLYPVVLQANDTDHDDGSPWLTGEFVLTDRTDPRRPRPAALFARLYRDNVDASEVQPYGIPYGTVFPGLASGSGSDRAGVLDRAAKGLPGRIGLVAVHSPADVPYALGWLGAANYIDAGVVSAVLRSWQDRFGAQLVRMGEDYLEVAVERPARTLEQAQRIAAEHLAVCPDQIYQGDYDTFGEYARSLVGATTWYCWWD